MAKKKKGESSGPKCDRVGCLGDATIRVPNSAIPGRVDKICAECYQIEGWNGREFS